MKHIVASTCAALVAAVAVCAPVAHADDTDTAYLDALHAHGISSEKGDQALIGIGHKVCTLLEDGISMNALEDEADLHKGPELTDADMNTIIQDAAAAYCPQDIP